MPTSRQTKSARIGSPTKDKGSGSVSKESDFKERNGSRSPTLRSARATMPKNKRVISDSEEEEEEEIIDSEDENEEEIEYDEGSDEEQDYDGDEEDDDEEDDDEEYEVGPKSTARKPTSSGNIDKFFSNNTRVATTTRTQRLKEKSDGNGSLNDSLEEEEEEDVMEVSSEDEDEEEEEAEFDEKKMNGKKSKKLLPGNIEKILSHRDVDDTTEFFVKWKDKSYLHCSWVPQQLMEEGDRFSKQRMQRYLAKAVDYDDSFPFNPSFTEVDRIVAKKKVRGQDMYFVKWEALQYSDGTWETAEDLSNDEKIKEFEKRQERPPAEALKNKPRPPPSAWVEYPESPEYKGEHTLRPYQLEGLNWLTFCWYNNRNSILADEMGLGKTVQTVSVINHLFAKRGIIGPFLIVAPLVTIPHWKREFEGWTDMNVVVYHGNQESRQLIREHEFFYTKDQMKRLREPFKFNVLVTTYEMVLSDASLLSRIHWRYLAIDEAHKLKNKNCRSLNVLKTFKFDHLLLLTGTPLQNNTEELWTLLNFMDSKKFGTLEEFSKDFGDLKDTTQVEKLHAILRPHLLRRMKEDVEKSIAPKEETIVQVALTTTQRLYYKAILRRNFDSLNMGAKSSNLPSLRNIEMQLRKCCNHPYLLKGVEDNVLTRHERALETGNMETEQTEYELLIRASGKMILLDKLLQRLRKDGHKVLIFSQMVRMLDILEDFIRYRSWPYERIDGGTKGNDRQAAIDRFSDSSVDSFVFLLCTRAGGLGINLTAADTVIIYDSDWNPQNDIQAQARCHRIGQTQMVKIYRLITKDTYEEGMFDKASMKLGLDQAVLTSMKGSSNTPSNQLNSNVINNLLKKGAYGLFKEEDSEDLDKIYEEDIDSLLARTSKVIVQDPGKKENEPDGAPSSSFSKASFVFESDPLFWEKLIPDAKMDNPLIQYGSRQRKIVHRYGINNIEDDSASSDSDFEEMEDDATLAKGVWSCRERGRLKTALLEYGYGQWHTIHRVASLRKWTTEDVHDYADAFLRKCFIHLEQDPEQSINALSSVYTTETPPAEKEQTGTVEKEEKVAENDVTESTADMNVELTKQDNSGKEPLDSSAEAQKEESAQPDDSIEKSTAQLTMENSDREVEQPVKEEKNEIATDKKENIEKKEAEAEQSVKEEKDVEMADSECIEEKKRRFDDDPSLNDENFQGYLKKNARIVIKRLEGIAKSCRALEKLIEKISVEDINEVGGEKPASWWTLDEDRSLIYGTMKYGFGQYQRMRVDPSLSFADQLKTLKESEDDDADMMDEKKEETPSVAKSITEVSQKEEIEEKQEEVQKPEIEENKPEEAMKEDTKETVEEVKTEQEKPDEDVEEGVSTMLVDGEEMKPTKPESSDTVVTDADEEESSDYSAYWPPNKTLTRRFRKVVRAMEITALAQSKRESQRIKKLERERQNEEKKLRKDQLLAEWSKREKSDFYKAITAFGVPFTESGAMDWEFVKESANLTRKSLEHIQQYYDSFVDYVEKVNDNEITPANNRNNPAAKSPRGRRKATDSTQKDSQVKTTGADGEQNQDTNPTGSGVPVPDELTFMQCKRAFQRLRLFRNLREKVLNKDDLLTRLKSVPAGSHLPLWWKSVHDYGLIQGVNKYGFGAWEKLCSDPDLPFYEKAKERINLTSSDSLLDFAKQGNGTASDPMKIDEIQDDEDERAEDEQKMEIDTGNPAEEKDEDDFAKEDDENAKEDENGKEDEETGGDGGTQSKPGKGKWRRGRKPEIYTAALEFPKERVLVVRMNQIVRYFSQPPRTPKKSLQQDGTAKIGSKQRTLPESFIGITGSGKSTKKKGAKTTSSTPKEKQKRKRSSSKSSTAAPQSPSRLANADADGDGASDKVGSKRKRSRVPQVKKYKRIAVDGTLTFPCKIGSVNIISLGVVDYIRPGYHNRQYIWPIGFKSTRKYTSIINPDEKSTYTCEILDGGDVPIFRVTADCLPNEPFEGQSPTAAWTSVLQRVADKKNKPAEKRNCTVSGPEYFGLANGTVAKLIQEMENADKCEKYQRQTFELFETPIKKKRKAKLKVQALPEPDNPLISNFDEFRPRLPPIQMQQGPVLQCEESIPPISSLMPMGMLPSYVHLERCDPTRLETPEERGEILRNCIQPMSSPRLDRSYHDDRRDDNNSLPPCNTLSRLPAIIEYRSAPRDSPEPKPRLSPSTNQHRPLQQHHDVIMIDSNDRERNSPIKPQQNIIRVDSEETDEDVQMQDSPILIHRLSDWRKME